MIGEDKDQAKDREASASLYLSSVEELDSEDRSFSVSQEVAKYYI